MSGLRVLMVEDSETDAKLVARELRRYFGAVEIERVETGEAMRAMLDARPWDVVVCDWSLPGFGARAALDIVKEMRLDIPFIIVSGAVGEENAVAAMRAGAHDYMLKDNLVRLTAAVERELNDVQRRRELGRQRDEERRFFDLSLDMMCVAGFDGYFKRLNSAWEAVLGWTADEMLAVPWLDLVHPDDREATVEAGGRLADGHVVAFENRYRCRDGSYRSLQWAAAPFPAERVIFATVHDITARKAAESALRASEVLYRALFDHSPFSKWVYDVETLRFLAVNDAAVRHYGYSRDEFLAMRVLDVREDMEKLVYDLEVAPVGPHDLVVVHRMKDGTTFEAHVTSHPLYIGGRAARLVVAQDVTATRRLEAQLRQAQKVEAIGSLAGGVAHDFNNILSVILGYTSMILEVLPTNDPLREDIVEVHKAGQRATHLTRQLLAFSRRQVLEPKVVDLGEVLAGMQTMIRRLVREDVEVIMPDFRASSRVLLDPNQLEQVVLNLAVNALDAMPKGGRLTFEVAALDIGSELACEHPGLSRGPHVAMIVSDTGCGMDAATRAHVFEPFFTTKAKERGTGLGLSTVLGIVEQSGGQIWVDSEPGHGATFTMCFPRATATATSLPASSHFTTATNVARCTETILLVEDDEQVRTLANRVLQRQGYEVLEAQGGGDALLLFERHEGSIDLLLTDVIMKHMSGPQLAERLVRVRPDLRVLFMSGYTDDLLAAHGVLGLDVALLQKPLTPLALLRQVRDVLDAHAGRGTATNSIVPRSEAIVLVVDDDDTVRALARRLLGSTGLTLIDFGSSEEALALDEKTLSSIGLLLTDVVMPNIDGHELAVRLRKRRPTLPVLFMSGYPFDVVAGRGVGASDDFMAKPFTARLFRERILRALANLPA